MSLKELGERIGEFLTDRFAKAFAEVAVVTICGILPFLLAVLRYNTIKHPQAGIEIAPVFLESFSGGQLFLYAFSLLGTLLWLAIFNWTIPRRPLRWILGLCVVIVGFALVGLGGIDPSFSTIQNVEIVGLSKWCYGLFTLIYFLLLLAAKEPPPKAGATFASDAGKMAEKLKGLEAQNG